MIKLYAFSYYIDDDDVNFQPDIYVVLELGKSFSYGVAVRAFRINPGRPNWNDNTDSFNHRRTWEGDFGDQEVLTREEAEYCVRGYDTTISVAQELAIASLNNPEGAKIKILDKSKEIKEIISKAPRRFIDRTGLLDGF